jgi:hypothetical protein
MQPPGYRYADMNLVGNPKRGCVECVYARQYKGHSVCMKHLQFVRMHRTCDDWNEGELHGNAPRLGLFVGFYTHESLPNENERKILERMEITE